MSSQPHLDQFIGASFGSVWTLEVLLLLAADEQRGWISADLVTALRASELVVGRAVAELTAAGLILAEEDGRLRYGPAGPLLRDLVEQTRLLYATAPDKVRRMIVRAQAAGLTAFADAFRIRKD
jgi:hypothetical protein